MSAKVAPTDTRAELIARATELITTRGFASFSFRDLAQCLGIRSASIHYHFPSKADLGVAVIDALRTYLHERWASLEREQPDLRLRLRCVVEAVKSTTTGCICPIGSLQAEQRALPEPVQVALRNFSAECLSHYTRWFTEGRTLGQLTYPGQPRAMASLFVGAIQAALERHRANPRESAGAALDQLLLLIGA